MVPTPTAVFVDCTPDIASHLSPDLMKVVSGLVIHWTAPNNEAELISRLRDHSAAIVYMSYISENTLVNCPTLKSISYLSTGLATHVDLPAAQRLGVRVRNVKGYGDRAVAEHTLGLIFATMRRIPRMDRNIRRGHWQLHPGEEVRGKTIGLLGFGGVGHEVGRLAALVDMRVLVWNRSRVRADYFLEVAELEHLLANADIVSLHLALNSETKRILNRERLELLKPGAVLINTARAELVDEPALVEMLQAKKIAAALDVFHREPLPPNHSFCLLDNVVLTSHSAWFTPQAVRRLLTTGLETLRDELESLTRER